MKPKHYAAIGGMIIAFGVQLSGVHDWSQVTTTSYVSGVIIQVGTFVTALLMDKPAA